MDINPFQILADQLQRIEDKLDQLERLQIDGQHNSDIDPDQLFTVKEAAQLLGLSTSTINVYANSGVLKKTKVGAKAVRFKRKDLMRFAEMR